MRIISSFRDYYDSVQAHGQDRAVVFVRELLMSAGVPSSHPTLPWYVKSTTGYRAGAPLGPAVVSVMETAKRRTSWGWSDDHNQFTESFLIIAGRAYPLWLGDHWARAYEGPDGLHVTPLPPEATPLGHPDLDGLAELYGKHPARTSPAVSFTARPQRAFQDERSKEAQRDRQAYRAARQAVLDADWTAIHLAHGSPVVLLQCPERNYGHHLVQTHDERTRIIVNPCLADLHVQGLLDPYTAFQAMAQFIGGVMPGQHAPMVTLTDRDQVAKKGFDPVYGFRTRPTA